MNAYNPDLRKELGITSTPDQAIALLNQRFQEHSLGYQFTGDYLVRMDSAFAHAEMVEPAIALLHEMAFKGASDEYMEAHKHYRHGENKDAAVDALKAVESTLKSICDQRKWTYKPHDSVGALIALVMQNGLIPDRFQKQFTQLEQLLLGLATLRNTSGGHGQGAAIIDVPDHLAAYALHQAAANIILLVEAHRALTT